MAYNTLTKIFLILACIAFVESSPKNYLRSVETNPFIVGGVDVTIEEYPFTVVCYLNNRFSCGGSILNENWILTAAHCTCHSIQWGVTVRDANGPNIFQVVQSIRYPGFTHYSRDDIQLLKLDKSITFGPNAQPVKLPKPGWEVEGDSYKTPSAVLGWGRDEVRLFSLYLETFVSFNHYFRTEIHHSLFNAETITS